MKRNTDEVMPNTTNEIVDVFMKESLRKRKQLQEDERRELEPLIDRHVREVVRAELCALHKKGHFRVPLQVVLREASDVAHGNLCRGLKANGRPCAYAACDGGYCKRHQDQRPSPPSAPAKEKMLDAAIEAAGL